jgi:hypothetical protein
MRRKYISESSNTLDLRLFLNDFVIEMEPLDTEVRGGSEEMELLVPNKIGTVLSSPA